MLDAGYSIRDIARELNLPESTIRYYRDAFDPYLPSIGLGRRRRYPRESVDLLRLIADGYARGLTREQVEAELVAVTGPIATPPAGAQRPSRPVAPPRNAAVSAALFEDERERRDVMWQMAREIVRMGERLERQQMMLGEIARRLEATADRTLTAGNGGGLLAIPPASSTPSPSATEMEQHLAGELQTLREELERERELVDRLRRSRLEIERRAMQAENALRDGPP